jgi:hypothetical protein
MTTTPIKINDVKFLSIREAAKYIHTEEDLAGSKRNIETIRKELKNINDGKRREGIMYNKFLIIRVVETPDE